MKSIAYSPLPLFDTLQNINESLPAFEGLPPFVIDDYKHTLEFLKSYDGNQATFNAYRREVERLLHWSWLITKKSVKDLRRNDIEAYLSFCQRPLDRKELPK